MRLPRRFAPRNDERILKWDIYFMKVVILYLVFLSKKDHLAGDYLRAGMLLPVLVLPRTAMKAAFDIYLGPFSEKLAA
jgi:hypothetical protein